MKYLKIYEEFNPIPQDIFYKFSYVHKSCGKGMIWNPINNSCQSKLDFINDRIEDGTFKTNKPIDKYLMSEIVDILYKCSRVFKEGYVKSLHSRYKAESTKITELIDLITREVKYGQLDRAKPAIQDWFEFITPKVSEINKKMWIDSTDGRKWATDLGKFEVYLELLADLESTEAIQIKLDQLSSKIFFYQLSTKIREYSEKDIMAIVDILNKYKTIKVSIEGWANFSDEIAKQKGQENLDGRRAESVKTMLISKGIEADRIVAVGKGQSKLVPEDEEEYDPAGNWFNKNMRVDIKIIK